MEGSVIIVTHSGIEFDILNPTSDMICLTDVAHALSNICRYTGHTEFFYSVAEHCVRCSKIPEAIEVQRACLLHDLSEAFVNDLSSPLKAHLPKYREIEEIILGIAFSKYGFHTIAPWDERIKEVDRRMLRSEIRQLMPYQSAAFDSVFKEARPNEQVIPIGGWCPDTANRTFLHRAKELGLEDWYE